MIFFVVQTSSSGSSSLMDGSTFGAPPAGPRANWPIPMLWSSMLTEAADCCILANFNVYALGSSISYEWQMSHMYESGYEIKLVVYKPDNSPSLVSQDQHLTRDIFKWVHLTGDVTKFTVRLDQISDEFSVDISVLGQT